MTSATPFERLHPAVQHHVVNSLGWRELRPLQERAIEPVLAGRHVLLGAPTAGGKTEAALLPLLSRMVAERWDGLSVLYLCPLRALLNNLGPRVEGYAQLLGRSAAIWHGDVGDAERRRLLADPPDILMTTPESLEAMMLSRRVEHERFLGGVRAIVVDEIHAFAGDDRGWHLLAVLRRLQTSGQQRLGLSATVGNPEQLLGWLTTGVDGPATVVMERSGADAAPELDCDFVGSEPNAARVIAGLHRGEKRLAFADSRQRVEEVATALRGEGVTTFVSHSSLSADERRQAERAFAESRDCVIVSTSTLELGIDVGDLDRVVQVGAPARVSSVLQRMGRTGRRAGTQRNTLFLATRDQELVQALALSELACAGWVEPVVGPARPAHLLAQQLLGRVLAEGRVGRSTWPGGLEAVGEHAGLPAHDYATVLEAMVERELLVEEAGLVGIGPAGEREYGRRNFLDVTSLFLTVPLLQARWGRREIGKLAPVALSASEGGLPTVLLAGRPWSVVEIDWRRQMVWIEPVEETGRVRWGGDGQPLSLEVAHAMRRVLAGAQPPARLSERAAAKLAELREQFAWARDGATFLVRDVERERTTWWTFAGRRATAGLAAALEDAGHRVLVSDDLSIALAGFLDAARLRDLLSRLDPAAVAPPIADDRLGTLKFSACLPPELELAVLRERERDEAGVRACLEEPVVGVS